MTVVNTSPPPSRFFPSRIISVASILRSCFCLSPVTVDGSRHLPVRELAKPSLHSLTVPRHSIAGETWKGRRGSDQTLQLQRPVLSLRV